MPTPAPSRSMCIACARSSKGRGSRSPPCVASAISYAMKINSLRLQLLAWVVLPLAGLATINLWTSHGSALATANLVTDRMLLGSARTIAEQVAMTDGVLDATIPPAAIEMFDTGDRDSV